MIQIIPSINVPTFEEVKERIKKVEPFVEWAHLDVTDGIFSKHLTWHNPQDLPRLQTKLKLEVHLMVEEPEKTIDQWQVMPIKRIIFHLEAAKDPEFIIDRCKKAGKEVGLAINPETFWGKLNPWLDKVDMVQILAVNPGPPGQKMQEGSLDKLNHLRQACPNCHIEIDGGINPDTIKTAYTAGANVFVSGFMFKTADIRKTIEELKALCA
ncbi:MAG: ribulose-phosphate 3-epimerase [bacterium]|nr:ribulose-phosphate 3-epimerase [bacterium]